MKCPACTMTDLLMTERRAHSKHRSGYRGYKKRSIFAVFDFD